ncbi:MAG: glycoside hydrolase family 5 protein [Clostridiales bacterium]|nr:glycoside hydrolase family 5 protein [Clostridiales bacterium]
MKNGKKRGLRPLALSVLLLGAMLVTACGGGNATEESTQSGGTDATAAAESTEAAEATTAEIDIDNASSIELVRMMGNGINLGNTMEAYGHGNGTDLDTSAYETYWGQPVTTQEMIEGMKAAGFDTIRIPVAWTNMMDYEDGDYTIGEAYLDRVQEIVDWAIDADMFVIVNDHWDGGWWGMFGSATEETRDEAMTIYTEMWTQIAERFANYPNQLIFESANEELGDSLNETTVCRDSGSLSEDECYETTNEINQAFVDLIRASGGNNANRFLLIAGYNTDIDKTCDDRYVMPTDSATDKLLISVHFYSPWNFCSEDQETQPQWGTKSEFDDVKTSLDKMTKFTDQGIGVVIGEYGAMPLADGTYKDDMNAYHTAILDVCDMDDYCPILWDRGDFYSKTDCKLGDDEMAEIYGSRNYAAEQASTVDEIKAAAEDEYNALVDAAPDEFAKEEVDVDSLDGSIAWIMWNGGGLSYSVGDTYNPSDCSSGLVATDAEITGEGTYTVGLDFTGCTDTDGASWGITFSALGISNAEVLYPGYIIDIQEIDINGSPISLIATPYTSSDDELCTRTNLINPWVSDLPDDARTVSGDLTGCDPIIIDTDDFAEVETIEITFDFVAP